MSNTDTPEKKHWREWFTQHYEIHEDERMPLRGAIVVMGHSKKDKKDRMWVVAPYNEGRFDSARRNYVLAKGGQRDKETVGEAAARHLYDQTGLEIKKLLNGDYGVKLLDPNDPKKVLEHPKNPADRGEGGNHPDLMLAYPSTTAGKASRLDLWVYQVDDIDKLKSHLRLSNLADVPSGIGEANPEIKKLHKTANHIAEHSRNLPSFQQFLKVMIDGNLKAAFTRPVKILSTDGSKAKQISVDALQKHLQNMDSTFEDKVTEYFDSKIAARSGLLSYNDFLFFCDELILSINKANKVMHPDQPPIEEGTGIKLYRDTGNSVARAVKHQVAVREIRGLIYDKYLPLLNEIQACPDKQKAEQAFNKLFDFSPVAFRSIVRERAAFIRGQMDSPVFDNVEEDKAQPTLKDTVIKETKNYHIRMDDKQRPLRFFQEGSELLPIDVYLKRTIEEANRNFRYDRMLYSSKSKLKIPVREETVGGKKVLEGTGSDVPRDNMSRQVDAALLTFANVLKTEAAEVAPEKREELLDKLAKKYLNTEALRPGLIVTEAHHEADKAILRSIVQDASHGGLLVGGPRDLSMARVADPGKERELLDQLSKQLGYKDKHNVTSSSSIR